MRRTPPLDVRLRRNLGKKYTPSGRDIGSKRSYLNVIYNVSCRSYHVC